MTRENQRDKILAILKERGLRGATNFELTNIGLRFGARIYELRRRGWDVEARREGESRWRFVLHGRAEESA